MYDLVSDLQLRSEELDRRIGSLDDKLDSILVNLQALPSLLSQAVTQQHKDFLDGLAHRVRKASSESELHWVPARCQRSLSTAPQTIPYSWQPSHISTIVTLNGFILDCQSVYLGHSWIAVAFRHGILGKSYFFVQSPQKGKNASLNKIPLHHRARVANAAPVLATLTISRYVTCVGTPKTRRHNLAKLGAVALNSKRCFRFIPRDVSGFPLLSV